MRWETTVIDVGEIESGEKKYLRFLPLEALPEIKTHSASCGCSSVKVYPTEVQVTIKKSKAKHLRKQKFRIIIELYFKNGSFEELIINGIIV